MPSIPSVPTRCTGCGKSFLAVPHASTRPPAKYCGQACYQARSTRTLVARFWAKVQQTEGCWLWTGYTTRFGHGQVSVGGKPDYAHRVSWELQRGPIPEGAEVCHNCPGGDNPRCVNPAHLWLGTQRANTADMRAKGRGSTTGLQGQRGERHPLVKLTEAQVRTIRQRGAAGEPHRAIAQTFGISRPTVTAILNRRLWKHV